MTILKRQIKVRPDGSKYILVELGHDEEKIRPIPDTVKPYDSPRIADTRTPKPYAHIASSAQIQINLANTSVI